MNRRMERWSSASGGRIRPPSTHGPSYRPESGSGRPEDLGCGRRRHGSRGWRSANLEPRRDLPLRPDEDLDLVLSFGPAPFRKAIGIAIAAGASVPGIGFEANHLAVAIPEGDPAYALAHVFADERPVQPADGIVESFGRVDREVEARQAGGRPERGG